VRILRLLHVHRNGEAKPAKRCQKTSISWRNAPLNTAILFAILGPGAANPRPAGNGLCARAANAASPQAMKKKEKCYHAIYSFSKISVFPGRRHLGQEWSGLLSVKLPAPRKNRSENF
jgi:hypothetical protein